jgi:hypothetical protein
MDTPTREVIRNAMRELGPCRIADVKARTRLSDLMLYTTILQMEDDGEILSNRATEDRRGQRVYRLAEQDA